MELSLLQGSPAPKQLCTPRHFPAPGRCSPPFLYVLQAAGDQLALGALLQRLQGQRKWVSGTQAVLSLLQEVGPGPADPWGTQQVCQLWYSWGPSPLGLQ